MQKLAEVIEKTYYKFPHMGNIVFIDVETTGREKEAKLIEIGAISTRFDGFEIKIDTFETLINPGQKVSSIITDITHITNEMLAKAPTEEVAYQSFAKWLQSMKPSRMVAHNAPFDRSKLMYNLSRMGIDLSIMPDFECTLKMARKTLPELKAHNLKALSEHFGYQNPAAHRALADTEACAYDFCRMRLL